MIGLLARDACLDDEMCGPKLLWLARHEGAVAGAIRRVLGSYDYVTWRLAGEWSLEQN